MKLFTHNIKKRTSPEGTQDNQNQLQIEHNHDPIQELLDQFEETRDVDLNNITNPLDDNQFLEFLHAYQELPEQINAPQTNITLDDNPDYSFNSDINPQALPANIRSIFSRFNVLNKLNQKKNKNTAFLKTTTTIISSFSTFYQMEGDESGKTFAAAAASASSSLNKQKPKLPWLQFTLKKGCQLAILPKINSIEALIHHFNKLGIKDVTQITPFNKYTFVETESITSTQTLTANPLKTNDTIHTFNEYLTPEELKKIREEKKKKSTRRTVI